MKEQFATYEIALKLKELGFDEECLAFYSKGVDKFGLEEVLKFRIITQKAGNEIRVCNNTDFGLTNASAPLWQQCLDWFREAHNLQVEILWRGDMSMFCYKIGRFRYASHEFSEIDYRQFEEAREQAILKSLELIQKK